MTAVADTFSLTIRDLLRLVRQPWFVAIVLVQPIIWLLLFGALFQRVTDIPGFQGGDYKQYLVPGVLVMTAFFSSGWNGMPTIDDINRGVVDRLLVTPVKRMPLIGGRVLQNLVQLVIQSARHRRAGAGDRRRRSTAAYTGVVVLVLAAGLLGTGFAALSNALALLTRQEESLIGAVTFLQLPLTFLSTAFMQPALMPDWIGTVATYNPVDWAIRAGREAVAASPDWGSVAGYCGLLCRLRDRLPAARHARVPRLPGAGVGRRHRAPPAPTAPAAGASAGREAEDSPAAARTPRRGHLVSDKPEPRPPSSRRRAPSRRGGRLRPLDARAARKSAFLLFGIAVFVVVRLAVEELPLAGQIVVLAFVYAPLGLLVYMLSKMPEETLAPVRRHGLAQPLMFVTGLWLAAIGWVSASLAFVLDERGVVDVHDAAAAQRSTAPASSRTSSSVRASSRSPRSTINDTLHWEMPLQYGGGAGFVVLAFKLLILLPLVPVLLAAWSPPPACRRAARAPASRVAARPHGQVVASCDRYPITICHNGRLSESPAGYTARALGTSRSLSGASGTSRRFVYSAPPRSASERSGFQYRPYCLRSDAGSRPTVTKLMTSRTGRRVSGTGGRSTICTASLRAASVTKRSSPSSIRACRRRRRRCRPASRRRLSPNSPPMMR